MPTYEFLCNICENRFEKNVAYNAEKSKVSCPNGHSRVRKIISVPSIIYKGSGFYKTDNREKKAVDTEKMKDG
jgi:putative FmdB family regulatory protein